MDENIVEEMRSAIFVKRRKKFKNADKKIYLLFILKIVAIFVYFESFFVLNYFLGDN